MGQRGGGKERLSADISERHDVGLEIENWVLWLLPWAHVPAPHQQREHSVERERCSFPAAQGVRRGAVRGLQRTVRGPHTRVVAKSLFGETREEAL